MLVLFICKNNTNLRTNCGDIAIVILWQIKLAEKMEQSGLLMAQTGTLQIVENDFMTDKNQSLIAFGKAGVNACDGAFPGKQNTSLPQIHINEIWVCRRAGG